MFETALEPGEIITAVRFPKVAQANYQKFRNPASRYAIVGVFVAKTPAGVRVAVTGAGPCVFRVSAMEAALAGNFSAGRDQGHPDPAGRAQHRHPRQRRIPRPPRHRHGPPRRASLRVREPRLSLRVKRGNSAQPGRGCCVAALLAIAGRERKGQGTRQGSKRFGSDGVPERGPAGSCYRIMPKANIHDRGSIERVYPPDGFARDAAENDRPQVDVLHGVRIGSAPDQGGDFDIEPASLHAGEGARCRFSRAVSSGTADEHAPSDSDPQSTWHYIGALDIGPCRRGD